MVCVLHQPSYQLFQLFHKVLLLSPGGRAAYVGSSADAEPYFAALGFRRPDMVNPADFYMDVLSGRYMPDPTARPCRSRPG